MARIYPKKASTGKRILLVDDQENYRISVQTLLEREGYEVLTASSGTEAIELVKQENFDLVLLDYFMPGGLTGEEVVREIRGFNEYIQVILQTGYSGEHPPREMMKELDIQGYHDKSDGPEKLLLWVDVGLKSACTVQMLYKSRQGLKYILEITPELHKIQMIENLLQGILLQLTGLLGIVNSFLAIVPEDTDILEKTSKSNTFLAMLEEESNLEIRAATGKFYEESTVENCLEFSKVRSIKNLLTNAEIYVSEEYSVIPLVVGETVLGVIYLEHYIIKPQDVELVNIFANQAAVAIQNAYLYSTATIDKLTGVYIRSFFEHRLMNEIRTAFFQRKPLSLILLDIDYLKKVNDTAGHLGGDQVLEIMGSALLKSTRDTDVLGRYGGDEFIVLLPNTPLGKAHKVTDRIYECLKYKKIEGDFGSFPIQCSMGICGLEVREFMIDKGPHTISQSYINEMVKLFINEADKMLYIAKRNGRSCAVTGKDVEWLPINEKK